MNPSYPVYIISKGRWELRHTSKFLEFANIPYRIVIEPQEYNEYINAGITADKILTLPFSNLGQGSIPARNWVWEHAISTGAERHWILDDNIRRIDRLHNNKKTMVGDGTVMFAAEQFIDRYQNVALAGFQYSMFCPSSMAGLKRAFNLNTRIYSFILIQNSLPYRWRGMYNEDTDLSLRALKDGWCTVLFNAFLCEKIPSMALKGGNTDQLYQNVNGSTMEDDGRYKMAVSLQQQHPDVTTIRRKWGRWQHHVDYRPFRNNRLVIKPNWIVPEGANEYGMQSVVRQNVQAA